MKKTFKVREKTPIWGKKQTKEGKSPRVGTNVTYEDGRKQTLLTPSGKGAKYAHELKTNRRYTNDMRVKVDKDGVVQTLTPEQQAYRGGYLDAQKDAANCYKSKKEQKQAEREQRKAERTAAKAAKAHSGKAYGDSRGKDMGIERTLK